MLAPALGHEHAEPTATGVCGLRVGVVDADVAIELGISVVLRSFKGESAWYRISVHEYVTK